RSGDPQASCSCGAQARSRGMRERRLMTCHGEQLLLRRYYYCERCRRGLAPLDEALGLEDGSTTPTVRRWIAEVAAKLPFEEAAALLAQLTPVGVSASTLERIAVATGSALFAAQQCVAQQHHAGHLPVPPQKPSRLYISMDGKMTPLRDVWRKD